MDSRSALSSALSARSYLELPHNTPSPEDTSLITRSPEIGTRADESKSTPRFTSRAQRSMSRPEMSERTPDVQDPPAPERPRKRGRPRLETVKDAAAIEVMDKITGGRRTCANWNRSVACRFGVRSARTDKRRRRPSPP